MSLLSVQDPGMNSFISCLQSLMRGVLCKKFRSWIPAFTTITNISYQMLNTDTLKRNTTNEAHTRLSEQFRFLLPALSELVIL